MASHAGNGSGKTNGDARQKQAAHAAPAAKEAPPVSDPAEKHRDEGADEDPSQAALRPRLGHADDEDDDVDDEDEQGGDDAKEQVDEQLRRKRDREGSLEPSLSSSQQGASTPDAIPTKKNRLQTDIIGEEPASSSTAAAGSAVGLSSSPSRSTGGLQEGEKVGQIRKRVRDLSWKQRKEGHRDDGLEENDEDEEEERKVDDTESKESDGEGEKSQTKAETEGKPPPLPRRTQPTFESFSSPSSGAPAPASSSSPSGASTATPVRKQPTFSLFSSSSSPFSSAAVNVAGPSWLAGKTTSSSTGIKPSTLGTSVGGGESSSSPSPAPSAPQASSSTGSSTPKAAASGNKQLGFGAFATSKPFSSVPSGSPSQAKSPSAVSSTSSRSDRQTSASADAVANGTAEQRDENSKRVAEKEPRSFDDVLREGGGAANDKSTTTSKLSTQLERGEADLRTGEENETSVYSARAKLYTMAADKSWKERGTGTVRCNVPKKDAGSARLVMRAEGVLRLILNVNLFAGMKIDVEQDKFVRIVAMEDGQLVHFALKLGNPAVARGFLDAVKGCIPAKNAGDTAAERDVGEVA